MSRRLIAFAAVALWLGCLPGAANRPPRLKALHEKCRSDEECAAGSCVAWDPSHEATRSCEIRCGYRPDGSVQRCPDNHYCSISIDAGPPPVCYVETPESRRRRQQEERRWRFIGVTPPARCRPQADAGVPSPAP